MLPPPCADSHLLHCVCVCVTPRLILARKRRPQVRRRVRGSVGSKPLWSASICGHASLCGHQAFVQRQGMQASLVRGTQASVAAKTSRMLCLTTIGTTI